MESEPAPKLTFNLNKTNPYFKKHEHRMSYKNNYGNE